jgi:hypothetical protein
VPIRPRGSAPAWGALCRVEIADYFADPKLTIQLTLYGSGRKTSLVSYGTGWAAFLREVLRKDITLFTASAG